MSNEDLIRDWKKLVGKVGYEEALSLLIGTKKVSASTAERLSSMQYRASKPSRKTREAILEALAKKAS